ncbi:MAG: TIGR01777 family oxidoreductase [Planctomycetota bacterium]
MDQQQTDRLMRIAVSGSTGLVGSALCELLQNQGRDVKPIIRGTPTKPDAIAWDTSHNTFDAEAMSKCDAVVHLAGENIMGRWTDDKKKRIYASRIDSTRSLATTLAAIQDGPRTLIVASASGYYGYNGHETPRTEADPSGEGFLAKVCVDWEAAADPAREAGIRVVHPRIGIVLSPHGGALQQMLPPFKLGLGGPIGDGKQMMSWIALHDLTRILVYCIDTPAISGPVNAVAPEPVSNRDFTKALGRAIKRPTLLPVPRFAPKLLFGKDCAEATALGSFRVIPKRLLDAGFVFEFGNLDEALLHEMKSA